jgi:hypothetical protein
MQINTDLPNYLHFGKKYFNISRSDEKLEDVAKYHNEDIGKSLPDRSMHIQIFRFICARSKQCVWYGIRVSLTYLDQRQGRGRGRAVEERPGRAAPNWQGGGVLVPAGEGSGGRRGFFGRGAVECG